MGATQDTTWCPICERRVPRSGHVCQDKSNRPDTDDDSDD